MSAKRSKIIVAGDVAVDWLQWPAKPDMSACTDVGSGPNWTCYASTRMIAKPGGAMLMAEAVDAATGAKIIGHRLADPENVAPEQVIHAITSIGETPFSSAKKDEKNLVYRIVEFHGYSGPGDGSVRTLPVTGSPDGASMVIFDDAGNGFRDDEPLWRGILDANPTAPILLKMSRPLAQGKLWQELIEKHRDRLIVLVSAGHMRECGVNISRCLSWERTAYDFVWQMQSNGMCSDLAKCPNLIVRFGTDAAIHYALKDGCAQSTLYYDPKLMEDGFEGECPGSMQGLTCTFAASLAKQLMSSGPAALADGIKAGIVSARRLYRLGYGKAPAEPDYPFAEVFGGPVKGDPSIAAISIPDPAEGAGRETSWTILADLARTKLETAAYNIVRFGSDPLLEQVPMARFGGLKAIDRTEIESYQSIQNLMAEYIAKDKVDRPLSIAVFGPPGAGKSFGVTELAKGIAPGKVEKIEFNVSQFESTRDLVNALHQVRDRVLEGMIPLVFFDEFDSQCGDQPLGWLRSFLMPMQDGKFKDGETIHPIGKAIFVFAGGTSHKYSDFYKDDPSVAEEKAFVTVKGPDFVSRLRGYVNILGPNPVGEEDRFYMIRRAMLLRFMLEKNAEQVFEDSGEARIDPAVLCAMIKVPKYRHGVRSLLAIIDMSRLSDRRRFEQSALPPKEQLKLHVDAEMFTRLLLQDVLFGESLEKMAMAIHEKYLKDNEGKRAPDDPAMQPWDELNDGLKESNRQQARQIPEKLQAVNCGMVPVIGRAQVGVEFEPEDAEFLARMEHQRYVTDMVAEGYTLGPRGPKTRPSLVPWEELPKDERDRDQDTVRGLPAFLAEAGFEIYRLP